jgi:hypothetical protein
MRKLFIKIQTLTKEEICCTEKKFRGRFSKNYLVVKFMKLGVSGIDEMVISWLTSPERVSGGGGRAGAKF